MAFALPDLVSLAAGFAFMAVAPRETEPPAKRTSKVVSLPRSVMLRIVSIMTATAITGSLLFNFTTNGNGQLLRERFIGIIEDPASGAANGLVAAYIAASEPDGALARGYSVSQGREMGHDAELVLRIDADASVWVGGLTQTVIQGEVQWPHT